MSAETEYKFILNKADFYNAMNKSESRYGEALPTLQINYYYDNEMYSLLSQDITLRVRQIGNELKLQRKIHRKRKGSFALSDEYEETITKFPDRIDGAYTLKGALVTYRRRIILDNEVGYIDFDENYYLGTSDNEIEIELKHAQDNKAVEIASFLQLASSMAVKGKSTRFFERLFSLNYNKEGVL